MLREYPRFAYIVNESDPQLDLAVTFCLERSPDLKGDVAHIREILIRLLRNGSAIVLEEQEGKIVSFRLGDRKEISADASFPFRRG